jgi:alpha-galactosidase
MSSRRWFSTLLLLAVFASALAVRAQSLALTPPMGWNSWDAYGLTINETDYRANAKVLAGIQEFGWKFAVIDEGWYMADPFKGSVPEQKYQFDANGLLIPAVNRFPSSANGAGFKPLAGWVHSLGLKFGIHIVRGIPREVVKENLPIAGGKYRAADAADLSATCPWDQGNYGVSDTPAGQAYYDAMMKLYASWGLDFIKVDCISDHPYRVSEIKQIALAIKHSGRPIVLSLSPGPTAIEHGGEIAEYAQMWRISDDHWDVWHMEHKPGEGESPFGLRDAFDRLPKWQPYFRPGNWPDEDMLPIGSLTPNPGWGKPRDSNYTHDEERTEMNLWAITRSPLILGANLTKLDDFTRSLITNQTLLYMNQNVTYSHPIDNKDLPPGFDHARVWRATIDGPGSRNYTEFFGFFNLDEAPVTLRASWKQLGLEGGKHQLQDVWSEAPAKDAKEINVTLPPHASAVFEVK